MNNYTFSALVIDDKFDEIKGFIDVLNSNGIATYYLNFVDNNTEEYLKNINNIRLIVTDLFNDKIDNKLEPIISVFDSLEEAKINNFILVIWTKHNEHYQNFIEHLQKYNKKLNFIALPLSKEDFIDIEENKVSFKNDKYEELSKKVKEHIESGLFKYFLEWEVSVNNKASNIINEIVTSLQDDDLKNIIKTLTQEEKTYKQKELYKILNTILSDKIASIDSQNIDGLDGADISDDLKAELNTTILFEKDPINKINNGNIYLYDEFIGSLKEDEKIQFENLICYEKDSRFSKDFYMHKGYKDDEIKKYCCNTIQNKDTNGQLNKECKNFHKSNITPILIDITPSCDVSNKKYTKNRLLFGYIYDSQLKCLKNRADYLYNPNFSFLYDKKKCKIILSFKELFSINPQYLEDLQPILRARKELSADIQQKVASHIARVGVFSLEDKR